MLKKIHVIATYLAITTIFLTMVLVFLTVLDAEFRLDILPPSLERIAALFSWLIGILGVGSSLISLVSGTYVRSQRE